MNSNYMTADQLLALMGSKKPTETTAALTTIINNDKPASIDIASLLLPGTPAKVAAVAIHSMPRDKLEEDLIERIQDLAILPAPEQQEEEAEDAEENVKIGVTRDIILNEKQQLANETILSGKSCVVIGAAGTGKTTSMKIITENLMADPNMPRIDADETKYLKMGSPGIVVVAFTRKATNNIRHAVSPALRPNTITLHKLLEFMPVIYDIEDPDNPGNFKKTMRFEPNRNELNPLPYNLKLIISEESSMEAVDLYKTLHKAIKHEVQEVFLGDIQQLPPVFGKAILGYKMVELPVIEYTEVYRQALDSPIIALAWKVLEGNAAHFLPSRLKKKELNAVNPKTGDSVTFHTWQKRYDPEVAVTLFAKQMIKWAEEGKYNPYDDIILCPFNKLFGTIEINKIISNHLGRQRKALVHEVVAGFNKHYLAVGDRVLYDKEDAYITAIRINPAYMGSDPITPSVFLNRHGHYDVEDMTEADRQEFAAAVNNNYMATSDASASEDFLDKSIEDVSERVQAASHVITVKLAYVGKDDETVVVLDKAKEVNDLLGGHALTIYKFQGSECVKVFAAFHYSHAIAICREALYTAITRARKHLVILCEQDTFHKGVKTQKIKGNTLAEKAKQFMGKM